MTVAEYFSTGLAFEKPIFDIVLAHLETLGPVHVEPVSVGIFFKQPRKFAQLRTMTKWVALVVLARPPRRPSRSSPGSRSRTAAATTTSSISASLRRRRRDPGLAHRGVLRLGRVSGVPFRSERGSTEVVMLYAFGFERIGVVASDLYFVDPEPGQEPGRTRAGRAGRGAAARARRAAGLDLLRATDRGGSRDLARRPARIGRPSGLARPRAPPPALHGLGAGHAPVREGDDGRPGRVRSASTSSDVDGMLDAAGVAPATSIGARRRRATPPRRPRDPRRGAPPARRRARRRARPPTRRVPSTSATRQLAVNSGGGARQSARAERAARPRPATEASGRAKLASPTNGYGSIARTVSMVSASAGDLSGR